MFDSNRPGSAGLDIWPSTLEDGQGWSTPVNLTAVNSPANKSRASLSWDGRTLTFGLSRPGGEGQADVFESTREKLKHEGS